MRDVVSISDLLRQSKKQMKGRVEAKPKKDKKLQLPNTFWMLRVKNEVLEALVASCQAYLDENRHSLSNDQVGRLYPIVQHLRDRAKSVMDKRAARRKTK